jgi:hypothetical protein
MLHGRWPNQPGPKIILPIAMRMRAVLSPFLIVPHFPNRTANTTGTADTGKASTPPAPCSSGVEQLILTDLSSPGKHQF